MKLFYTVIALAFSICSVAQDFKTSTNSATFHTADYYGSVGSGIITPEGKLIHHGDDVEIIDLSTGKTEFTFDFDGSTGQTWIDPLGRYIGNYSQNASKTDQGWQDAMHVLDLSTKKVYSKSLSDGYWNKGVFHPNKTQVLMNEYNAVEGTARILLFDFVGQKEVKTFFSTSKFSTVVMALAFSKDGSRIYAGIAPNGYTSYINVYDTNTGNVLKKINFKYNLDKIFVSDDFIFTSGEGSNGSYTSRINASDYSVDTWDTFRMDNMSGDGKYSFGVEYKSNILSQYDLESGKKTDLFDISSLGITSYMHASAFSPDAKWFFMAIHRSGKLTEQGGNKALVVFRNELIEQDDVSKPIEEIEIVALPTSYNYKSSEPKFSIDFELEPEVTKSETSSGASKITIKHSPNKNIVYMVLVSEMSKKIKESKYTKTASDIADKFVEKTEAPDPKKSTFNVDGQEGTEYTFTKKGIFYRYRSICIEGQAYQIIYLNSSGNGEVGADFFNSFTTK